VLTLNSTQQLRVPPISRWQTKMWTRWSKYTAPMLVATVDDNGQSPSDGPWRRAVTAWYLSRIAIGSVTVPLPTSFQPEFREGRAQEFIDDLVPREMQSFESPPSRGAADENSCVERLSLSLAACPLRRRRASFSQAMANRSAMT